MKISHSTPEIKNIILTFGPCQSLPDDLPNKMFLRDTDKNEKKKF